MKEIDSARLPQHIAIIMDGNGRWAERHAMGRILGHRKGAESVRMTVQTCRRIGIRYLTLYAFSVENWLRPEAEVRALLNLLQEYLENEVQEMMDQDIRLMAIGNLDSLGEPDPQRNSRRRWREHAGNQGMILNLALSYGGRDEIVDGRETHGRRWPGRKDHTGRCDQGTLRRLSLYRRDFPIRIC